MSYAISESIGPFWVEDEPLAALAVTLVDADGYPVGLEAGMTAQAFLALPAGTAVDLAASVHGDTVTVQWDTNPFANAGIYGLALLLSNAQGSVRTDVSMFVVDSSTGWHTLASSRTEWRDAPDDDAQLYNLLEVAREQCETYAPALPDAAPVPTSYKVAQLMQTRNLWNTSKTDPASASYGEDGFAIRVYPMDWTVKNILRPKNPVPVVA